MHTCRHTSTFLSCGMPPGPQCFHRQDWDKEWGWLLKERLVTGAAALRCAFTATCPVWSFYCGQSVRTSPPSSMHTCTPVWAHTQISKALRANSFKGIVPKNESLVIIYSSLCISWVFSCHFCFIFIWSCTVASFTFRHLVDAFIQRTEDMHFQFLHFLEIEPMTLGLLAPMLHCLSFSNSQLSFIFCLLDFLWHSQFTFSIQHHLLGCIHICLCEFCKKI